MERKQCRACGVSKPLDQFYPQKLGAQGRRSRCIECYKADEAARYHRPGVNEERREMHRSYYRDNTEACKARVRKSRGKSAAPDACLQGPQRDDRNSTPPAPPTVRGPRTTRVVTLDPRSIRRGVV